MEGSGTANIYTIVGPPSVGKTELAKRIAEKYFMDYVDLEALLKYKTPTGKMAAVTDDNEITRILDNYLRSMTAKRIIVDKFPRNMYQLRQFEKTYAPFTQIFAIQVDKDVLIQKALKRTPKKRSATVHKEMNEFFRAMIPVIEHKKTCKLNGNNSIAEMLDQVGAQLEPEVILFKDDENQCFSKYMAEKCGYEFLKVDSLMQSIGQSETEQGSMIRAFVDEGKMVPTEITVSILREIIYSSDCKKFAICDGFPTRLSEVDAFEAGCASFKAFYISTLHKTPKAIERVREYEIETRFFEKNKLHRFVLDAEKDADEQLEKEFTDVVNRNRGRYILINGYSNTGRSTVASSLYDLFEYEVVSYEELPEAIKARKSTEDDAYENVTWEDIIEEIELKLQDKDELFVLDGFPPRDQVFLEEPPEDGPPQDYAAEIVEKFIPGIGLPYVTLNVKVDMEVLKKRLFTKLDLGEDEELTEEHLSPFEAANAETDQIIEGINALRPQVEAAEDPLTDIATWATHAEYDIPGDAGNEHILDAIFKQKIILTHFDENKSIDNFIKNLCINYNLTHVNAADFCKEDTELDFAITEIKNQIAAKQKYRQQVIVITGFPYVKNADFPRPMDCLVFLEKEVGSSIALATIHSQAMEEELIVEEIPVIHFPEPKEPGEDEEEGNEPAEPVEEVEENAEEGDPSSEVVTEVNEIQSRSDHRPPVSFAKTFQLMKRDIPSYQLKHGELNEHYEEFLKAALGHIANGGIEDMDDNKRLDLPHIQILI